MKKKVILSSIVTIALCLSLIAGSTFALFTSEQDFNIAVNAGNVKIAASMTGLSTSSFDDWKGTDTFELGGTAKIEGNKLTLDRMVPGDAATVTIDVENAGTNVSFAYKVVLKMEGELADALRAVVTIGDAEYVLEKNGDTHTSPWENVTVDANGKMDVDIKDVAVTVSFPNSMDHEAQNEYQGKTADIYFQIIAVQGNGTEIYDYGDSIVLAEDVDLVYFEENLAEAYAEKKYVMVNVANDITVDEGKALITEELAPEVGKVVCINGNNDNGHSLTADTIVTLDAPIELALVDLDATVDNAIVATNITNLTLHVSNCNFTVAEGGKVLANTDGSSARVIYAFGTITVNGTEVTEDNFKDYFDADLWFYQGEYLDPAWIGF
ncbi:MAG: hypothetical protein IJ011_08915 [Clostridia bacterium]|nr:hypothetical protein [Clostridia bacterium]